jgi:hypothetical protein
MLNATQNNRAKLGSLQVEGGMRASVGAIRVSHQKKRGIMTVTEMIKGARTIGIPQRFSVDPVVSAKIRRMRPPGKRRKTMIRRKWSVWPQASHTGSPVNNPTPTTSILPLGPSLFGGVGIKKTHIAANGNATTPMKKKHHCQLMRSKTPAKIKPRTDPRAPEDEKLKECMSAATLRRKQARKLTPRAH